MGLKEDDILCTTPSQALLCKWWPDQGQAVCQLSGLWRNRCSFHAVPTKLAEHMPPHSPPDPAHQPESHEPPQGSDLPSGPHLTLGQDPLHPGRAVDVPSAAECMLHMQEAAASLHDMQVCCCPTLQMLQKP